MTKINIPNGGIESAVTQQVIDLQNALSMGIKLFCVNCNRAISKKAVVDLSKSAKANGNKFFEQGKLVRGGDALLENPERKFISLDGKEELTIDSPDIDKSYVIIDGQHRCLACIRFGCNMDFLVMDEASSIGSKIILINTRKSNWNGTDFATYISATEPKAAETIATIKNFAKFDGMAPKVACLFIGINRNTMSRTNLQSGKVDSLPVKQVENALLVIGALYNKLDQGHRINSLIAQSIYAIRKELDAAEHESFATLMAVAISQMSEETVSSLVKAIDNKNQGKVKSLLQTAYITLRDKDTDASEFEPVIIGIKEKVKEIMDAEATVTEPKSFSFSDCDYALRQAQIQGAVFFKEEETGCRGSNNAELSFFDDCRYVIQCDRKGNSDFITTIGFTDLCSHEFISDVNPERWGYREENGLMTDVEALKENGLNVSACNISCGYYNHHTDQEITVKRDLLKCWRIVQHIIEDCTDIYPHQPSLDYDYYGGYYLYEEMEAYEMLWNEFSLDPRIPTSLLYDKYKHLFPGITKNYIEEIRADFLSNLEQWEDTPYVINPLKTN